MGSNGLLNLWIVGVVGGLMLFTLYVVGGRLLDSGNKWLSAIGEGFYIGSYLVGISFGTAFGMIAPATTIAWGVSKVFGI